MSKKSQIIKRVFGFNRNKKQSCHGGIEHLSPGKISGWAISTLEPFYEVRLLAGPHLIARADINQPREDVSTKFNFSGNPGFSLTLPYQLPVIDWDQPIRLLALSVDGTHQAEIHLQSDPHKTRIQLQKLLQSESLGMDGHFDGIIEGYLQGWAAKRDQKQPSLIWLHCKGREPIPIVCDQIRDGMENYNLPRQCGFRILLSDIPADWKGLSIKCCFDRSGLFNLPQNQPIFVPLLAHTEVLNNVQNSNNTGYQKEISSSCNDLKIYWEDLEMLRLILDDVELKLDNREKALAAQQQKLPTRKNWFRRLLGIR
jgi:hypothetical protein